MGSEDKVIGQHTGTAAQRTGPAAGSAVAARPVEVEVPAHLWPESEKLLPGIVVGAGPPCGTARFRRVVLTVQADGEPGAAKAHNGHYYNTLVRRRTDGARRVGRLTVSAASAYAPRHVTRIIRTGRGSFHIHRDPGVDRVPRATVAGPLRTDELRASPPCSNLSAPRRTAACADGAH
ncbi:hypothetical protein MMF93_00020 [Streptomyces tubbatahanensis]|uniref:Uncharacterized protein n=1 Tax=Streptomyces tubbatahanensis TaxID=2923272 RepID=A0ABY3XKR7_9ACTN|nr:hypothetical protein [Streptomyces tubbatahanensis]UNS95026.1 hypothetical protein MMF93_00020 [Streptomyces tubbatahanensis]